MDRRTLLRRTGAGLGTLALSGTGVGTATTNDAAAYVPMGSVDVAGAAEAVVGPDGETTYVATGDGFATVDVTDPGDPTVLATVTGIAADRDGGPLPEILDVKVSGDRLLVVGPANRGSLAGLVVYDVSDPAKPTQTTDFYRTGFAIHNADFDGEYAYLTNNDAGNRPMTVVDVSGGTPVEVGRWSPLDVELPGVDGWSGLNRVPGVIHDLYVHGETAYCVYWDAGTWLVDVSDPADPAYVTHVGDYDLGELVSLSNQEFGRMYREAPGNDHYVTVDEDADLMAVGGEGWDDPATDNGGPAGIDLWDVTDPTSPERLATIRPETAPDLTLQGTWTTSHNFDLANGRLYSSWYDAGVKLHDVSDPANPELLAWWRDPDRARFWTAQSGIEDEFFVASSYPADGHRGGLYVFPDEAGEQLAPPAPFEESEKWYPEGTSAPIPAAYYDDGGVVTTDRLQRAIRDWVGGEIDTETLNLVIRFWASGRDVRDAG
jgi:hypothetical protein